MKLPSGLNENWRLVSSQLYEVLSVSVTERPRWLANLRETSGSDNPKTFSALALTLDIGTLRFSIRFKKTGE
jgi:hypothetical protein